MWDFIDQSSCGFLIILGGWLGLGALIFLIVLEDFGFLMSCLLAAIGPPALVVAWAMFVSK